MQGYAAAVDVKHGRGHAILIGFRPQWRGQPFGTFRVIFNSALFGRELADRAKGAARILEAPKRDEKPAERLPRLAGAGHRADRTARAGYRGRPAPEILQDRARVRGGEVVRLPPDAARLIG